MLKMNFKLLTILTILILLFAPILSYAEDVMPITQPDVVPQITESDLYIFDDDVVINTLVDGNIFIMGNNVTIDTQIGGSAFIIGNNITLTENSYIYSNLFAMANSISINGIIVDGYIMAGDLTIEEKGFVYRDLKSVSNNLNIYGTIQRNCFATANSILLKKDNSETIGKILGTLTYSSENELVFPDKAIANGINFKKLVSEDSDSVFNYLTTIATILFICLILFLICAWQKPKCLTIFTKLNIITFIKVFGIGLVSIILIPIISFVLLFTVIGIPMSFITMFMYVVLFMISQYIFSIILAHVLLPNSGVLKRLGLTLLISLVIYGLSLIPYVGYIIRGLVYPTAFGFMILPLFRKKEKKLISETSNTVVAVEEKNI